jgi:hypothetical protein
VNFRKVRSGKAWSVRGFIRQIGLDRRTIDRRTR